MNGRLGPRVEALAQAVAERAVGLVVSALDVNGLLGRVFAQPLPDGLEPSLDASRSYAEWLCQRPDTSSNAQA